MIVIIVFCYHCNASSHDHDCNFQPLCSINWFQWNLLHGLRVHLQGWNIGVLDYIVCYVLLCFVMFCYVLLSFVLFSYLLLGKPPLTKMDEFSENFQRGGGHFRSKNVVVDFGVSKEHFSLLNWQKFNIPFA